MLMLLLGPLVLLLAGLQRQGRPTPLPLLVLVLVLLLVVLDRKSVV